MLGHSRGAIATQAIAGADPLLAQRWAGAVAASHYDGAEQWPYSNKPGLSGGGAAGAINRAHNLDHVPKFLTGECDLETGIAYRWLRDQAGADMEKVTSVGSGFREHTGFWILRPSRARTQLRAWVSRILDHG